MIDPSLFSSVLKLPTNGLINNPFSGSAFSTIHSAIGGLPSVADLANAAKDPNMDPTVLAGLQANLAGLNTISASGSLASMDGIVGQMTSHVAPSVGAINTVPTALFSMPGVTPPTSSIAQSIGVPNAMSMLSSAQSSQSLANQMLGNASNAQQCGIIADITGAVKSVESAIGAIYGAVSSEINALEATIGASVSRFAAAVRAALPTVTIDPISGLQVIIPGSPIASSVLTEIASDIASAYKSVTGAISTVIGAIDAAAVSIENSIKLGIAGMLAKLNADPCFGTLAKSMTSPALAAVLTV